MADIGALRLLGLSLGAATVVVGLMAVGTVIASQQHSANAGPIGYSLSAESAARQ